MTSSLLSYRQIEDEKAWHAILYQLPTAHPLQSWTWGAFKSRWSWRMKAYAFYQDEAVVAAAMILKRPIPYTRFSFLYCPKGPVVAYDDPTLRDAILANLEKIAGHERAILIKIDPDVPHAFGEEAAPNRVGQDVLASLKERGWTYSPEQIQFKNTVMYDIGRSEEEILAGMKQKTRYNVRQGPKKGVAVRQGTVADLPLIYEMYKTTADRDRFLIRPEAYYLDGWSALMQDGLAMPLIAEYEGEALGAIIIVKFGEIALYMYGASTGKERKRMPNYMLQWEGIRWAKSQGCTVYDFWGAPDRFDESDRLWGVYRFKRGFNGTVAHHIGAWDYPTRPFLYRLFTQLLPKLRAAMRGRISDQ